MWQTSVDSSPSIQMASPKSIQLHRSTGKLRTAINCNAWLGLELFKKTVFAQGPDNSRNLLVRLEIEKEVFVAIDLALNETVKKVYVKEKKREV
ncbi:MAG: hypothetical protein N3A69_08475 [Leptospiraceae bacterium]|nr:hypothetical protein [Leptospiraceae bacterium]